MRTIIIREHQSNSAEIIQNCPMDIPANDIYRQIQNCLQTGMGTTQTQTND